MSIVEYDVRYGDLQGKPMCRYAAALKFDKFLIKRQVKVEVFHP
jgi:hypothetical protein